MKTVRALARGAVVVNAIIGAGSAFAQSGDVNVYTYRESKLIQPLFDAFSRDTGIKVNVISASSGLEQRIKAEGANSPADVLLTVDIGRIEDAVRARLTQPIKSDVLDKIVAPHYRDPEGHWYGISMRARVVYASKDRVKETALNYEDLSDPKWKGKICIRSGQYIYNNAMFAAFIAHHGEAKTEEWLSGLKANLAQKPSGGDREVARDIAAGKCDIGVANTYYWALMLNNEPDRSLAGVFLLFGFVLYPSVYLAARAMFQTQGQLFTGPARMLGARPWELARRITVPLARPAMSVGVSLALLETLNDIGASEYL